MVQERTKERVGTCTVSGVDGDLGGFEEIHSETAEVGLSGGYIRFSAFLNRLLASSVRKLLESNSSLPDASPFFPLTWGLVGTSSSSESFFYAYI